LLQDKALEIAGKAPFAPLLLQPSKTIFILVSAFLFSAVCEPAAPGRRSAGCQAILHHPGGVVRKISRNASKHVFSVFTKLAKFSLVKDLLLLSISKIMCREFLKMNVKKLSAFASA
jgi:hypothetical protein